MNVFFCLIKDRTNPPFPVVNDLTLVESLVRTTQLIFIN